MPRIFKNNITYSGGYVAPAQAAFKKLTLEGVNIIPHVTELKIYESLMRPFIVTEIVFTDTNNFGNIMRIEGGESLSGIAVTSSNSEIIIKGRAYKQETGENVGKSVGSIVHFATEAYFGNKTNKVTLSRPNAVGSSLIQEIASTYLGKPITKLIPSKGLISEREPYQIRNELPLDAINKIRKAITSVTHSSTGAYTFFENKYGLNLLPLEGLFSEPSNGKFIQKETLGTNFTDMAELPEQIIGFRGGSSFGGSAMGVGELIRNITGVETNSFNTNEKSYTPGNSTRPPMVSLGSFFAGLGLIGKRSQAANFLHKVTDTSLRKFEPMKEKGAGEKALGGRIQGSGSYTMTVLLDEGSKLTAGQMVEAYPLYPKEDLTEKYPNRFGGRALVVNCMHLIRNYATRPQGITIVECAQGGFNV